MEEKQIPELSEEALDAVTGGAYYKRNEETGLFDVFDKDGELLISVANQFMADNVIQIATQKGL